MTWKTHLLGGIAASAGAALLYHNISDKVIPYDVLVPGLVISGLSALLPDVDEIKSKAGKILLPVSLLFFVVQTLIKIITAFTFGKLKRRIRENTSFLMHRGICHYPITVFFISIAAGISVIIFANDKRIWLMHVLAFTIGLLSHIILDIVSGRIALLFPFSKKRIGMKLFESGGAMETMIARPALLILCIMTITKIVR